MIKANQPGIDPSTLEPQHIQYIGKNLPTPTVVKVHVYDHNEYQCWEKFDFERIAAAKKAGMTIWVDICGLADTAVINEICHQLAIHPLVIEDMLHTRQRPKLEFYDDYLFVVFNLLQDGEKKGVLAQEQISFMMHSQLLLTLKESNHHKFDDIYTDWQNNPALICMRGVPYLLYTLVDTLINSYFKLVDDATAELELLEDRSIHEPDAINPKEIYLIKRRIIDLRKNIAPLRDIFHTLLKEGEAFIPKNYLIYYRDLFDHTARLIETINFYHELTTETLSVYVSFMNTRMNQTMKILTLFASLFIPLNFIVGLFGMNFVVMPILHWKQGFHAVLAAMVFLFCISLYYFKKKKLY